jgi:hypothetical protein
VESEYSASPMRASVFIDIKRRRLTGFAVVSAKDIRG